MRELLKIEPVVRTILETDDRARYDDMYLFEKVVITVLGYDASKTRFGTIMEHYNEMGLPHFESVRRCRQKLQSACENLRPTEVRQRKRLKRETDYVQYSGSYI